MEPYEYLAKALVVVEKSMAEKAGFTVEEIDEAQASTEAKAAKVKLVVLEHCGFCGRYEPIVERLWNVPACGACRAMVYDDQDPQGGGCAP